MPSTNIDPDDSHDLTGVVGYELAQSYETAKTLLLFGLATYAVGIPVLTNSEPVEGLPTFPELITLTFGVFSFIAGLLMIVLAASVL